MTLASQDVLAYIYSHNVRRQLGHPPQRQDLRPPPAARDLSRGRQGQASNAGQPHPLQTGRGRGDPAGAETQGRFGPHAGVRRRERAGVEAGSLGGGGLGSVTVGARTRRRRRPGLRSAGQAGAVADHCACARSGLAPVGGSAGRRPRRRRGAGHGRVRRGRPLRQSGLAGGQPSRDREPVVCSERTGLGARRLSLRRDQHIPRRRAQRLCRVRLQPGSQVGQASDRDRPARRRRRSPAVDRGLQRQHARRQDVLFASQQKPRPVSGPSGSPSSATAA